MMDRAIRRLLSLVPVVLLLQFKHLQTSLCIQDSSESGNVVSFRQLSESPAPGIRVPLIQRDSLFQPPTTTTNLWQRRVERSKSRAESLYSGKPIWPTSLSTGEGGLDAFPPTGSFQTPVAAASGEYLAILSLGTPSQSFNTILDTGSDLTWLQCDPCRRCYTQDGPHFNPLASSTFHLISCHSSECTELPLYRCDANSVCNYGYQYGDRSFTVGNYSLESLTLETVSGQQQSFPNFRFGCGFNNQGTFRFAGGLLGLGRGPFSFISQLGPTLGYRFSYCLLPLSDSFSGKTSPLLLGAAATPTAPGVLFTPLLSNPRRPSFYYLPLQAILVDGVEVQVPAGTYDIDEEGKGGTVIDSGTTLTALIEGAYQPVLDAVKAKVPYPTLADNALGLDLCFAIPTNGSDHGQLPEITLVFQGAKLVLPQANSYVLLEDGVACWAFFSIPSDTFSIIGNVQQQQLQVFHDVPNSRVGFVSTDCEKL